MELDDIYGELRLPYAVPPAKPWRTWEEKFTPFSMLTLDAWNARYLKEIMGEIVDGWCMGNILFFDAILIWVVNKSGEIVYALEELVLNRLPANVPKHQNLSLTKRMPKLGHPALVLCEAGRIAGEIKPILDSDQTFLGWKINNKSGRYGLFKSRRKEQLENVAGEFSKYGIDLTVEFIRGKN